MCKFFLGVQPKIGRKPVGNKKKSDITTWAPEDLQIREVQVLRGAHLYGQGDRFAVLTQDNIRTLCYAVLMFAAHVSIIMFDARRTTCLPM